MIVADRAKTRRERIPFESGRGLESRMGHIAGFERDQLLLLPEAVDDYVDGENPVRFIDAFVDGLDLAAAGSRASRRRPRDVRGMRPAIC